MARRTARVEGFADASRTLSDLGKRVARGVGRTVLRGPAQLLADEWRQRAPKLTDALASSITIGNNRLTKKAAREARTRPGVVELAVIAADPAAVPQEFGAKGDDPQPYARPGIDAAKPRMREMVAETLTDVIGRAAERAERRAARAARGN